MLQQTAWQITVVLTLLMLAIFLLVALRASAKSDFASIQKQSSRIRIGVFWGLVLLATPILVWSLGDLPYSPPISGGKTQRIEAVGHQWYWTLSDNRVLADRPVEFHVTSADVNHGFGIYDPELRLVAQTQAMPGYVNVLRHTFSQSGVYKILCLEYCGLAHHSMSADIVVTDQP